LHLIDSGGRLGRFQSFVVVNDRGRYKRGKMKAWNATTREMKVSKIFLLFYLD
jgi:hypothetical protein